MAKHSSKYWEERFALLEEKSNTMGLQTYMQVEQAFKQAERKVQGKVEAWYARYAINNNISMLEARKLLSNDELEELKWDVQEYIKRGKENSYNQLWIKELENASAKYHISRLESLKLHIQQQVEVAFGNELDEVDRMASEIYQNGYYKTIFEVQKGIQVGFPVSQIDTRKLELLIQKPWATDGRNFSERIWGQRIKLVNELHEQLTLSCILGKAPDDAIRNIAKQFKTTRMQAGRLIMTEQAYFHSVAQQHAYNELDVEEYEIVATLDSHTSAICKEMDGKHFPMKEYKPGSTAPPFHVWCRSVTVPYFDDEFTNGKRAARGAYGKTYYVPENMTYKEWKKENVNISNKAAKEVVNNGKSGILKVDKVTIKSKPNSITQKENKNGGIDRNYYGDDGRQISQVSNHNHGNAKNHPFGEKGEHIHDYIWEKDKLIDRPVRELTATEREENKDIL